MKVDLTQFEGMTPGKWKLSLPDDCLVIDQHGDEVATAMGVYDVDCVQMEANARAIAALPDIIEDLRDTEAERAHHAMTAGCLRTDLEYANARIAKLEAAVEIAKEYFYERQDVNWEGTAGNEQMKCLQEINEALEKR